MRVFWECGAVFAARKKYLRDDSFYRRWCCITAANEGTRLHTDAHGTRVGCDVGKLLRDDDARQMLRTAVGNLRFDADSVINNVTALAVAAIQAEETGDSGNAVQLQGEIERVEKKREAVLDCYFSGDITKEDMQTMKARYDDQLENLRRRLRDAQATDTGDADALRKQIREAVVQLLHGERGERGVRKKHP